MPPPSRWPQGPSQIRLRLGSAAGHRDCMLIRRETAGDGDAIRTVTTAAFAPGYPPGQVPPEPGLVDELRAGPAWLPPLSLVAATPGGEVSGAVANPLAIAVTAPLITVLGARTIMAGGLLWLAVSTTALTALTAIRDPMLSGDQSADTADV